MSHPALDPAHAKGHVAVVTGGASGIGLAAAKTFGKAGLKVVIADLPGPDLDTAATELAKLGGEVLAVSCDVTSRAALKSLKEQARELGPLSVLMSNAGREGGGDLFASVDIWRGTLETNLMGTLNTIQIFVPDMIAASTPAAVIVTGSKQGITLPPGDVAYNVSKAGLKALTESLSHVLVEKTGKRVSAHLLIPGFTYTGFTKARGVTEKPAGAWTPEQVADFMMAELDKGSFYILCPDNEVNRETDIKRMSWAMGDIIENRPALSRWHPDYAEAFAEYMKQS